MQTLYNSRMLLASSETIVLILHYAIHVLILMMLFSALAKAQFLTGESYSKALC